jgi:hypothetical protein
MESSIVPLQGAYEMELLFAIILLWGGMAVVVSKDDNANNKVDTVRVGEVQTRIIMQKREVIQSTEVLKEWNDK